MLCMGEEQKLCCAMQPKALGNSQKQTPTLAIEVGLSQSFQEGGWAQTWTCPALLNLNSDVSALQGLSATITGQVKDQTSPQYRGRLQRLAKKLKLVESAPGSSITKVAHILLSN